MLNVEILKTIIGSRDERDLEIKGLNHILPVLYEIVKGANEETSGLLDTSAAMRKLDEALSEFYLMRHVRDDVIKYIEDGTIESDSKGNLELSDTQIRDIANKVAEIIIFDGEYNHNYTYIANLRKVFSDCVSDKKS